MTRTPPWLFRQAKRHSLHAANLLLATRSLPAALNELRWIKEHVDSSTPEHQKPARLANLCRRRGQGIPLQYILGSQPFGPLDIKCTPGVLIPRPETESYTYHLANLIKRSNSGHTGSLRILDLCSGTGCIPLLLFALLQRSFPSLTVRGVDIARKAVSLAEANLRHNSTLGLLETSKTTQSIGFSRGNVFSDEEMDGLVNQRWDFITSNPPYISEKVWNSGSGQLGHSVRKFEPALALVPGSGINVAPGWERSDAFYARLLDMANTIRPKLLLLEVGDEAQALRVASQYLKHISSRASDVELWRDWPDLEPAADESRVMKIGEGGIVSSVTIRGSGSVRCVLIRYT